MAKDSAVELGRSFHQFGTVKAHLHDHVSSTTKQCSNFFGMQHKSLSKLLFYSDWNIVKALPAHTVKPVQLIQNAAARVVFNKPKRAHITPPLIK